MTNAVEVKSDSTIVTPADRASEKVGKEILRKISALYPSVSVHGEESGVEGRGDGDIVIYLDPLDGSMPYAVGSGTSTVIVAVSDKKTGKVLYCFVGEPQSGKVWRAANGGSCESAYFEYGVSIVFQNMAWVQSTAYQGVLDGKSRVFIDSYPGFTKGGRVILRTEQLNALHARIQEKSGMLMLGSNGLHHALVANGGNGAVGAITTAIGGPWDVCPVLLVLSAGGFARAFTQTPEGLAERDPLCVAEYDIVISGNTEETVNTLTGYLLSVQ
jgi:fructose-1,6-bisphosphatase/inositol monophosphatase family enzyme